MTVTKRSLGGLIRDEIDLTSQESEKLITDIFENIACELENGKDVLLFGFGIIKTKQKSARPGRNPKTGEVHEVSSRKVCQFRAGVRLKEAVKHHAQSHSLSIV